MKFSRSPLFLLVIYSLVLSHGFAPGTLVKIPMGYKPIEQLDVGEMVISLDSHTGYVSKPITHMQKRNVSSYVQLQVAEELISTTVDQRFYLASEKQWIKASLLECRQINNSIDLYDLTVADCHNFCVTKRNIIAHNYIPVQAIFLTTATVCPVVAVPATTVGTVLIGGYILFKQWQQWKKNKKFRGGSGAVSSAFPQPPNNDDEDKEKEKGGPHGKYENASYHTPKGNAVKSKCPKNGQKALDNSLYVGERTRIAIEGGEFVVLKETSPGVYHGHVRIWEKLTDEMQKALRKAAKVRLNGKIIK